MLDLTRAFTPDGNTHGPLKYLNIFDGVWSEKFLLFTEDGEDDMYQNPSIAVNESTGDLHVITEGMTDGTTGIAYRKRIGKLWNDPQVIIEDSFSMDVQLDVVLDGQPS